MLSGPRVSGGGLGNVYRRHHLISRDSLPGPSFPSKSGFNWYFMGLFQTGKNVDETQTMFEYLWEKKGVEGRMPTSTRSLLHAGSLGVDGVESTPLSSRQEMSVCTVDWLDRVEEGDESTLAVVVGSLYTCELEFGTKGTL